MAAAIVTLTVLAALVVAAVATRVVSAGRTVDLLLTQDARQEVNDGEEGPRPQM